MSDPIDLSKLTADLPRVSPDPDASFGVLAPGDEEPATPAGGDAYVAGARPREQDVGGPLPWIVGAFSIVPFLEKLRAKAVAAAEAFEVKALQFVEQKLDAIPGKPAYDDEGTLRQFDPLVRMQVGQAWSGLSRRQQLETMREEFPEKKIGRRQALDEPPPKWTSDAARALLARAELSHDASGGLQEAGRYGLLAGDFSRLGLFQDAADVSLEAARLYERVNELGSSAAQQYAETSAYAEAAGNAQQAADAMLEANRIWIAAEIERSLRAKPAIGDMVIGMSEMQVRIARFIAQEAVEDADLLARLVEYRAPVGEDPPMPKLREGWRRAAAALLGEGASGPVERAERLLLAGRGGTAADRLAVDQIVRYAKHDEELRRLFGEISDPEMRLACEALYREWKQLSQGERSAREFGQFLRNGRVERVGRMAVEWLREELRLRRAMRAAEKADAAGALRDADGLKDAKKPVAGPMKGK